MKNIELERKNCGWNDIWHFKMENTEFEAEFTLFWNETEMDFAFFSNGKLMFLYGLILILNNKYIHVLS